MDDRSMRPRSGDPSASRLVADLRTAASALIAVLQDIEPEHWTHIPSASEWSIGKDAEHVAEAATYHQWIVRRTVGEKLSSRRPVLEWQERTTTMTVRESIDLIRLRTDEGAARIASLTDAQLALPTRPPRARGQSLAETIEAVLIGHYDGHRHDIERKLRDLGAR